MAAVFFEENARREGAQSRRVRPLVAPAVSPEEGEAVKRGSREGRRARFLYQEISPSAGTSLKYCAEQGQACVGPALTSKYLTCSDSGSPGGGV